MTTINLRDVADVGPKIGAVGLRTTRFGQSYFLSSFAPIVAPDTATQVFLVVDRSAILEHIDKEVVTMEFEVSLDGGATYPLMFGMTTGGLAGAKLPDGMSTDAFRSCNLPPDQGMGRLIRPAVGAKQALDLGVKVVFA